MAASWEPDIYSFTDFQAYLQAYYDAAKANTNHFSYRYFSRRAGYSSPNMLQLVIQGKRRLTADGTERFIKALKLRQREATFFRNLVAFNQAGTDRERNEAFEKICGSRRFREARKIDNALYQYTSRWYIPAIREMAARDDFRDDPDWIAAQLLPPIKKSEASQALEVLFDLELLERTDAGIDRGDPALVSAPVVRSLAVTNYHRQMLQRAAESMELVESDVRELGALTVCVSPELVPELVQRARDFRAEIGEICDRDPAPRVVYQINLQVFPLSREDEDTPR